MIVREARRDELPELLALYLHLHETEIPEKTQHLLDVWMQMTEDSEHHIIVAESDGQIAASCICVIVPNLTRNVRPYALIENVVARRELRGRGLATACLRRAEDIARRAGCYKMMLLTGSKSEEIHRFYRQAGYRSEEKTAFVRKIEAPEGAFLSSENVSLSQENEFPLEWNEVTNNAEANAFLAQTAGLHDSVIRRMDYISGAYVDEARSMYPIADQRQLRMWVQSQMCGNLYLVFERVSACNLRPPLEDCTAEILDCTLLFEGGRLFFCDGCCEAADLSYGGTYVLAERMRWRFFQP